VTEGRRLVRGAGLVAGRILDRVPQREGRLRLPAPRTDRASLDAETGEPRLLTTSLDRNCAPYPEVREPVWDGDSLLFVLEESGIALSTALLRRRHAAR
jgi:hypothetical protein